MSGPGRPHFLPPEEPPAPPPPPPPPPSSYEGRRPLVLMAVVAAGLLLCGAIVLAYQQDRPRPVPGLSALPAYTRLPDFCAAPGNALPAGVRAAKPERLGDSCRWEILGPDRSRVFEIELRLESDGPPGTGVSGTVKAIGDLAQDRFFVGDPVQNGGDFGDPEDLRGVGDEAFAAPGRNLVARGGSGQPVRSYVMGGARVEARARNAVITVDWQGADYPKSIRGKKKLTGTLLAYASARTQSIAAVETALAALR